MRRLGASVSDASADASASSQGSDAPALDSFGFVLANAGEVESKELYERYRVGIVVCVLGMHSRQLVYPPGVRVLNFAIAWEGGRKKQCEN